MEYILLGRVIRPLLRRLHILTCFFFMSQRPVNEIIEHAKSQLGNSEYHLLVDNCQHFCTDCRYDKRESAEIRNLTNGFFK